MFWTDFMLDDISDSTKKKHHTASFNKLNNGNLI